MNTCAAEGCEATIPLRYLMCPGHWRLVPGRIQMRVYHEWNGVQHHEHGAVRRHHEAKAAAVAAVAQAEGRLPAEAG